MSHADQELLREKGVLWDLSSSPNDQTIKKADKLFCMGSKFISLSRIVDAQRLLTSALDMLRGESFDSLELDDPERFTVDVLISKASFALVDCLVLRRQFEEAHREALKCETVQELHPICSLFKCIELLDSGDDLQKTSDSLNECVHLIRRCQNSEVAWMLTPKICDLLKTFHRKHKTFFQRSFSRDCNSPKPLSVSSPSTEDAEAAADAMTREFDAELAQEYYLASTSVSASVASKSSQLSRGQKRNAKAKKLSAKEEVKNEYPLSISTADTIYDEVWYNVPPSPLGSTDGLTDEEECLSEGSSCSLQDLPSSPSNETASSDDCCSNEDDDSCSSIITLRSLEPQQEDGSTKSCFDLHAALVRGMEQKMALAPFSKFNEWRRMQKSQQWAEWTDSDSE